ncbi:MAG: hypothetical protein J0L72_09040 [Armatimonadetes bacterium]|nr:hypothetical protein [Armatimonadota bacterium]
MKLNRPLLWASLGGLLLAQGALNQGFLFPRWKTNYASKTIGVSGGLSPDQLLATLAGFREMVAGLLWVRADSFFDSGNYDAILPIIRLVTILDPKQRDVYATGIWHIAYNFTDEESRSDRRYIPSALALGAEGARNNPETYELFFETGWTWYHKVDDLYPKAVEWLEKAKAVPDIPPARGNVLGMAYQRNGQPDKALAHYYAQYDAAVQEIEKTKELTFGLRQQRDTVEGNLDNTIVRMAQRGVFGRAKGTKPPIPYDTDPPFDTGFSVQVQVIAPKRLLIRGTWNVRPIGTRVRVVLKDKDYPNGIPAGMQWDAVDAISLDPPRDLTYMQDALFVRNQMFRREVDMSKDPTMYPFTKDNYTIEFYYNPRSAPPHIQDKFGYSGEGMTDKNFLRTDIRPGQRVVYTSLNLTKAQINRTGEWRDRTPIIQTQNFVESDRLRKDQNIIQVPGLRSQPTTPQGNPNKTESLRNSQ